MEYIKLGRSGLEVSPICIGSMGFGDPTRGHPTWALGEEGNRPVIKHAIEAGINFFDTANLYSQGTSEVRKQSLKWLRRSGLKLRFRLP